MEKQKLAYIYAISAVLIWSTVASAFKITLKYLDFIQMLFYASLFSLIILFLLLVFQGKLKLLKSYSKKDYIFSGILGFLNPCFYYIILFKAYDLLKAQEAQALNYTWSLSVVILSIPLLKQKIKFRSILAILISFFGVLIISTEGNLIDLNFTNVNGVILALGSTIIWALYWIYSIKDKRDEVAKLFLNFSFGFIFILIITLIFSEITIPKFKGLIVVMYIGFFEMGITFVIWLKALKLSKTTAQVSILIYISPFISLGLINTIVGEKILISTIIGLLLIVGGILFQKYEPKNRNK